MFKNKTLGFNMNSEVATYKDHVQCELTIAIKGYLLQVHI